MNLFAFVGGGTIKAYKVKHLLTHFLFILVFVMCFAVTHPFFIGFCIRECLTLLSLIYRSLIKTYKVKHFT